jgi:hypothetical protein
MRTRAERRHHDQVARERAAERIRVRRTALTGEPVRAVDPKQVGKEAAVHSRACSCPTCGGGLKRAPTLQEIRQDLLEEE